MNNYRKVAGNRKGYKIYNFNTSIRVPDKNIEFLKIMRRYEGKYFTNELKYEIYKDAIQSGTLTPVRLSDDIKNKIKSGDILTEDELTKIIIENRPSNGIAGRVGDYVISLENQALIQRLGTNRGYRIRVTELGKKLLEENISEQDVYTRAMIGLQYGSPTRNTAYNKAIPFLNTLFIINEMNNYYKDDPNYKGITLYDFGVFVLSMKDCNYKKVFDEIIEYKKVYGTKELEQFAYKYLEINNINKYDRKTIYGPGSYADEVLRKFKKTGLLVERAGYKIRYINFNRYELTKIKLILDKYKNYSWKNFKNKDAYFEYLENIMLPWEESKFNFYQIIKEKAKAIKYCGDITDFSLEKCQEIEKLYYKYVFDNNDYKDFPYENIKKELGLINRTVEGETSLPDVEEFVRLEWFSALLLASKFGKEKVTGNLILDDNGLPLSQAPGGSADVELFGDSIHYNIEVTTIRNKTQQTNMETTTVSRHLANSNTSDLINKAMLVAPFIHEDTIRYYKFEAKEEDVTLVPITIDMFLKIVDKSLDIKQFDLYIEEVSKKLKSESIDEYKKFIKEYE